MVEYQGETGGNQGESGRDRDETDPAGTGRNPEKLTIRGYHQSPPIYLVNIILASVTDPLVAKCSRNRSLVKCWGKFLTIIRLEALFLFCWEAVVLSWESSWEPMRYEISHVDIYIFCGFCFCKDSI